jgi:hypothetical protein
MAIPVSTSGTAVPPAPPEAAGAALDNWYMQYLDAHLHGFYNGNNVKYKGARPSQIYQAIRTAQPGTPGLAIGNAVLGIWTAAAIAGGIAATTTGLGTFVIDTGKAGAAAGNTPVGHAVGTTENAISKITSPLDFLTSQAFWVRAGETFLGLALVTVGMVKLSETSSAAKSITGAVPGIAKVAKFVK